ncbi:MAG: GerMN domain-containing protein [Clostridiales bacterium]|jgi:spore germination protein GerM|nr:GerMN domain-containing protein [Clostridiales bacterium]
MKITAKLAVCLVIVAAFAMIFSSCKSKDKNVINDEYTPASSLVMTEEEAAALSDKMPMTIYYATKDGMNLAGEVHLVTYGDKNRRPEDVVAAIVQEMINGPSNKSVLKSTMPDGTKVNGVKIVDKTAIIDLNSQFSEALPADKKQLDLLIYSIVDSVTELKNLDSVKLTIDGKEISMTAAGTKLNLAFARNLGLVTAIETLGQPEDEGIDDDTLLE